MASNGSNDRKRHLRDADPSPIPMKRQSILTAPSPSPHKSKSAPQPDTPELLEVQNKRQADHIQVQRQEILDLNNRIERFTEKQSEFSNHIARVGSEWNKMEDHLGLLLLRLDNHIPPKLHLGPDVPGQSVLAALLHSESSWDDPPAINLLFERRCEFTSSVLTRVVNAIEANDHRTTAMMDIMSSGDCSSLKPFHDEISSLRRQLEQSRVSLQELHVTHASLIEKWAISNSRCENLGTQIAELDETLDRLKNKQCSLTRQITSLNEQLEESRRAPLMIMSEDSMHSIGDSNGLMTSETSCDSLGMTREVSVYSTAVGAHGREVDLLQVEVLELRASAEQRQDEIDRLNSEIQLTASRHAEELTSCKATHNSELWSMWNRAEGFRQQLEKVEGEKAHHAADMELSIKTLRSELDKLRASYEGRVQYMEGHMQKLQEEVLAVNRAQDAFTAQKEQNGKSPHSAAFINDLNSLVDNFKQDKHTLKAKLKRLRVSEAKLKQDIEQLLSRRLSDTGSVDAKGEVQLRQALQEAVQTSKKYQQLSEASQAELDSVNSELEVVSKEYEEILEQNVRLCGQLREKDDANAHLVAEQIKTRQMQVSLGEERNILLEKIAVLERARNEHNAVRQSFETRFKAQTELLVKYLTEEKGVLTQRIADETRKTMEMSSQRRDAVVKAALSDKQQMEDSLKCKQTLQKNVQLELRSSKLEEENSNMKKRLDAFGSGGDSVLQEELRVLKQGINCSVCSTRKKDTILTKCYHMFCRHCVTKNLETRLRRCPTCKRPFGSDDTHLVYL